MGRNTASTIHIKDLNVSGLQCLVKPHPTDGWHLEDRGSNSTRVNGAAVGSGICKTLRHGDVILCGKKHTESSKYRFELITAIEHPEVVFWRTCPWSPKNR